MKSTAHLATKMCPRPQVGGFKAVLLHYLLYAKRKKGQAAYAKSVDGGDMTTINIIGVVMLIGGVPGCGALFLWVLTEDKRKERKEGKKCTKASIIVTIAASGWTRGVIMSRRRLGLKEI